MYAFPLKELLFDDNKDPLKYRDLLCLLLMSPKLGQGMLKDEVRYRTALARQIVESTGVVHFENKDFQFIKDLADHYLWGSATAQLDQFLNDLDGCAPVEEAAIIH